MFEQHLPPEYEVAIYHAYEKELLKRSSQRRLTATETDSRPSLADELLLIAGNALIALGERLRARSVAAELVA
jgi:hypothetical protein